MSKLVFLKDRELLETTPVDNVFITRFMPLAPELAVKAYIYGLMLLSGSGSQADDLSAALGCTDNDIRAAFAYWESVGLVKVLPGEPLQVQYLNIRNALAHGNIDTRDSERGEFVRNLQSILGTRMITGSELSKFYDWLDVFGFEEAAAAEIVRHCLDRKGARTSVSYMDAVARTLAGKGCLTHEAVMRQFEIEDSAVSGAAAILRRWRQTRPLTEDEIAMYRKWTEEWGFDNEAIDAALTMATAAMKPSFKYLDGTFDDWRRNGTSGAEILKQEDAVFELARQAFSRAGLKSRPSSEQRREMRDWHIEKHMSAELILLAAELSAQDIHPYACMKRLINEWYSRGIASVSEANDYFESEQRGRRNTRSSSKNNRALNYIQGEKYTKDDLKRLGISLGEELYDSDEQ